MIRSKFFNVDFRYGTVNALNSSSKPNFVRCVRGNVPAYCMASNDNATVTDNITTLVWEQGTAGPMNWESAIDYCENLSPVNSRSWRLPNFKELETLRDNTRYDPSLDSSLFTDIAGHYWSSTTYISIPALAYVSNFSGTIVSTYAGKMANYFVKCVQKK